MNSVSKGQSNHPFFLVVHIQCNNYLALHFTTKHILIPKILLLVNNAVEKETTLLYLLALCKYAILTFVKSYPLRFNEEVFIYIDSNF